MEFDAKQKVLLTLYLEYQKDIPCMESVTQEKLAMDIEVFNHAVHKLENESLIEGSKFSKAGGKIITAFLQTTTLTPLGLVYIEEKLAIPENDAGIEKVRKICQKAADWTWERGREIAEDTLAVMA